MLQIAQQTKKKIKFILAVGGISEKDWGSVIDNDNNVFS